MGWLWYLVPKMLLPTFTWPHQVLGSVDLAYSVPPTPRLYPASVRRVIGFLHYYLIEFSWYYSRWCGIPFNTQVADLPFGLVLKWSDGTRLEEVAATMMARSAGFPVPKIVAYADHPYTPHAPMKGLGDPKVRGRMTDDERESVFAELQCMLKVMRKWEHPEGGNKICSMLGTAVRSVRIPNHAIGPCQSGDEFNDHLFSRISDHSFESQEKFKETVEVAERLREMRHPIVFTHGDLKHHNIMVMNGHITAFLDWESAGWYPDYWEFTTPLRFGERQFWWNQWLWRLGGENYGKELESEKALIPLSVDAWAW